MGDLFKREQQIIDEAYDHLNELRNGLPYDYKMYEIIVIEYGIMLRQLRKLIKISDKASVGLLNDQMYNRIKIDELENELIQNQISIMYSQIRPHFLYNSLVAIKELCYIDPITAGEAVGEFSNYLRGNLDSLSLTNPVPFEKELRHVETYLSLESKRFAEKLRIEYDISTRSFLIPALTLQPIVENAVRHGVTMREEGGTVSICTSENDLEVIITVKDDGVGYDQNIRTTNGRIHLGINNVRNRLAAMCGGSVKIRSKPGVGTIVEIVIPKQDEQDEGDEGGAQK